MLGLFLLASTSLHAQQIDEVSNQKIREYTTDKRFLPSSVLNLPDDPKIPSPRKHFGDIIGAPGVEHHSAEIYAYFKALEKTSPQIKVQQIGTSEEGRPFELVVIANEETIGKLDYYKKQLALLADPRQVGTQDVEQIIAGAKPIYYLNGGLHSPEMGPPEMLMELAYRLITDKSKPVTDILNNIIVIINPVAEPDGRDKQVDWYYRYTKSRKEYSDGFMRSSPYWGKYAMHDNNRDGFQISQELTKAATRTYLDWHPTVMHDLHESVPLLYISTGTGPYNEATDPMIISEWETFAHNDMTALAGQGLPGIFTWAYYDGWYPGYLFWIANNHNSIGRFYETFGNAGANTYLRDLSQNQLAGDPITSRQWYRPDPATEKVMWSSRNNINFMEAGVLASLTYTASNSSLLLHNFYKKGLNNIKKGTEEFPRAYVIPKEQHDPAMAAFMVNQLRTHGLEVHRAESGTHAGDYVVLLDQPYRNLAVTLLSKQNFPKDSRFPPHDDIAWTFGYLYGVDVKAENVVAYNKSELKLLTADVKYTGKMEGEGTSYLLNYKAQANVLPSLYWIRSQNKGAKITMLDTKATVTGIKDTLAAGTIIFSGLTAAQSKSVTEKYGLDLIATNAKINEKQHEVSLPRIAIYHSWSNTQDEGWARFTFEQQGIPYTSIDKDDLKGGGLNKRFDAILMPRMRGSASDFINDIDKKYGPMPFTKTAQFPSHGTPDATQDMTGGPGLDGVDKLKQFIEAGGLVVALDNSALMIADAGIVRDLRETGSAALFHPGSVVTVKVRKTDSPILYGFPEVFPIFRGIAPLLTVADYNRDMMVLQYGTPTPREDIEYTGPIMGMEDKTPVKVIEKAVKKDQPYVLSGMVKNEQTIVGQGVVFNVPVGSGHVVAFTFDPLHRYQNLHDAPLVWNALINWNHL